MHRIEETIARGMCIGCGACAAATGGAVRVSLGPTRLYGASIESATEEQVRTASRVCPFSDESPNEDDLLAPQFDGSMVVDPFLGSYTRTFAGRVRDEEYLEGSSSGGLTSWLVDALIAAGHVDAAINVGAAAGDTTLFEYDESTAEQLSGKRKSQYYATTMADVLSRVQGSAQRYVLVGVPCFIRAARALCRENPVFADRVVFFVALVCGHYKTQAFADSLAWQLGIHPNELESVDFRKKRRGRVSSDYDFEARSSALQEPVASPVRLLAGGNWGHSAFQPEACNFCDDVVGETADVSFGDAWLPEYLDYSLGTNVVVSRNRVIDKLFDAGADAGEILIFEESADRVISSQAGGFRHRRDGLAIRLADDAAAGLSVPKKRVEPAADGEFARRRVKLTRQRRRMAELSHRAFAAALDSGDLDVYLEFHRREAARYNRLATSFHRRVILRAKRTGRKMLDRLFPRG